MECHFPRGYGGAIPFQTISVFQEQLAGFAGSPWNQIISGVPAKGF